ncbi:type II toxin-antitoxin system MqsA family antitoxin [Nostoc sp.]|uniref:type II toxin-antitoxin system MqsA family antitoxin n=1 Tax=Nostoc sp. TaxID=1180 RepID=UPI002FF9C6B5
MKKHIIIEKRQMLCDICGSEGVKNRRITRTCGNGKDLLVIENIPAITCTHCGENYLTAETLHKIEQIKTNRKKLAVERPVEVATFGL